VLEACGETVDSQRNLHTAAENAKQRTLKICFASKDPGTFGISTKSHSFLFNCPLTAFSEAVRRNSWLLESQTRGNLFLAHWPLLHKNKLRIQRDFETSALLYVH